MTENRNESVGGMSDRERLLYRLASRGGEIAYDVAQLSAATFDALETMAGDDDPRAVKNLIERVAAWWRNLATDANDLAQFLATGEREPAAPEKPEIDVAWETTRDELEEKAREAFALSDMNGSSEVGDVLRYVRQALTNEVEEPGRDYGRKALIIRRAEEIVEVAAARWAWYDE